MHKSDRLFSDTIATTLYHDVMNEMKGAEALLPEWYLLSLRVSLRLPLLKARVAGLAPFASLTIPAPSATCKTHTLMQYMDKNSNKTKKYVRDEIGRVCLVALD